MPGQMRVTYFFTDGDYGWTETLFPATTDYNTAVNLANAYAPIRQGLLCTGVSLFPQIQGYRVSDDSVFRDALVQFFQPPLSGTQSGNPLPPFVAVLARLTADPLVRRPIYLRGIPSGIYASDGTYQPTGPWLAAFNNFRNFLIASPAWLVKTSLTEPLAPVFLLNTIIPPNNFNTLLPHTFNAGDIVIVKGSSRNRNPVGRWKVGPGPGPTNFSLPQVDLPSNYVYTPLSLGVQKKGTDYKPITIVNDERITRRATGRPFGAPRGRRSPHRV